MEASHNGDVTLVETLLNKGENVNTVRNQGMTALTAAVEAGHHQIVELLLRHGASIHACHWVPLLYHPVRLNYVKVVEVLLRVGNVNPNEEYMIQSEQYTWLHSAVHDEYFDMSNCYCSMGQR